LIYDPLKKSWEKTIEAPADMVGSARVLAGDRLFSWSGQKFGRGGRHGNDGCIYDFRSQVWKQIDEAPILGRMFPSAKLIGSKVVVWGGWMSAPQNPAGKLYLRDGAIYDLDRDTWRIIADLPENVPDVLHPGW